MADVLRLWINAGAVESTTDDEAALRSLLARDPEALVIAAAADQTVGTLIVGWDGWRGALYRLAVLPAWRRRGVARSLVVEAQARLRELGARRVAAMVITDHHEAVGFWSSMGYEADPRLGRFVRML